jgi:hypothetical protein
MKTTREKATHVKEEDHRWYQAQNKIQRHRKAAGVART